MGLSTASTVYLTKFDDNNSGGRSFGRLFSPSMIPIYLQNDNYGYTIVGEPTATSRGYQITLNRIQGGTMFGDDIDTVNLEVTFDTNSR